MDTRLIIVLIFSIVIICMPCIFVVIDLRKHFVVNPLIQLSIIALLASIEFFIIAFIK
jgi:hypothetical protein